MNRQTVIVAFIASVIAMPVGFGAGWLVGHASAEKAADSKMQTLERQRVKASKKHAEQQYQTCLHTAEMLFYQIDRNHNFRPYTVQPGEGFNQFRTVVDILCSRDATEGSPLVK